MANEVKDQFIRTSNIVNINILRGFFTGQVEKSLVDTFKDKKFNIQDKNAMMNYFKNTMTAMQENGTAEAYVNLVLEKIPRDKRNSILKELEVLMVEREEGGILDNFATQSNNDKQCSDAGVKHSSDGPGCDPRRTFFPKIRGPVRGDVWSPYTWCNNCWLCTLPIKYPKNKKNIGKECEHILPYITGSYFLATSNKPENANEFGQSHSWCNRKKNQGEFIKFEYSRFLRKYKFVPDYNQITAYVSEMMARPVSYNSATGLFIGNVDVVLKSNTSRKNFEDVLNSDFDFSVGSGNFSVFDKNAQESALAKDMVKSIIEIMTGICDLLNDKGEDVLIATFLHATILDWLLHKRVIQTYQTTATAMNKLRQMGWDAKDEPADDVAKLIYKYNTNKTKSAQQKLAEDINYKLSEMRGNEEVGKVISKETLSRLMYLDPRLHKFGKRKNISSKIKRRNRTNFGASKRPERSPSPSREQTERPEDPDELALPGVSWPPPIERYIPDIIDAMSTGTFLGAGIINQLTEVTYGSVLELLQTMDESDEDVYPRLVISMYKLLISGKIKNVYPGQYREKRHWIFIAYVYSVVVYIAYKQVSTTALWQSFGKKKPKVKKLPNKALMTKLKSVGIKITRKRGKRRVYLSRPELIKKATAFRNLQLRAKKLKVRIMYKNKKGKYTYKTAKRLHSDIKRQISKMKKLAKKSTKKPAKKPAKKQIKQRFG